MKTRIITIALLILVLAAPATYGQHPVMEKKNRLTMPRATLNDTVARADYHHSIDLRTSEAVVTLNGKKHHITYDKLESFFKKYQATINKKPFSIIVHVSSSYNQVVDVLDLLVEYDIEDYQFFNAAGELMLQEPTVTVDTISVDSSFLNITILSVGYKVAFLNKTIEAADTAALEQFITEHKNKIDQQKVVVYNHPDIPYELFAPLMNLLRRNNIYRYKLISK